MRLVQKIAAAAIALTVAGSAPALAAETIRIGVLKFGTVNWELSTIERHGLDQRNGFTLEVLQLASNQATTVALQYAVRCGEIRLCLLRDLNREHPETVLV